MAVMDVSIIVPIHNEEHTLGFALNSIEKQNIKQIIIILDRCTDGSEKIARLHKKKNKNIEIYKMAKHKNNINFYAETVNYGISKIYNKYICIVDADTYLEKKYIEKLMPHLKGNVVSVSGTLIPIHKKFFQYRETIRGTGRLILKKLWDEIGGYQDVFSCDTLLDLEILMRGLRSDIISEATQYDLRRYSMKNLISQAIRFGKGRKHLGQSFFFLLGHGLYTIIHNPFGVVILIGNIVGYFSTDRKISREKMSRYEILRLKEITKKYFM